MPRLSLSIAWDETRAIAARDSGLYASVALALIVLPETVLGMVVPQASLANSPTALFVLTITIVIGFIAQISLNRLALGPSTTVGAAIGRGLARMPALFVSFLMLVAGLFILLVIVVVVLAAAGLISTPGAGQAPPASLIMLLVVCTTLAYAVFQLTIPVAAAESGGPIRLFARAWALTRGNYWRLFAFVILIVVGIVIVLLAGQFAFGALIALVLGPPKEWSLSALLIALESSVIQAAFTVISAVMLARIYVQLSGRAEAQPAVPTTGI